jgi:ferredoxin
VKDGQITALVVSPDGKVMEMNSFAEMEKFVSGDFPVSPAAVQARERIHQILDMPREQRWEYWQHEMQNCIKCYACRSACPLCYCTQCTVESNKPQWIPVASHNQGNLEWHIIRAMHMAGRCIGCGECTRACPMDLPVGLISMVLNMYTQEEFGQVAGMKASPDYALGTFKVEDKENFIR